MNEQNNQLAPKFDGYSPFEMHNILHFTFGENSPIKLQKLSDSDYKLIPIFNQIKYLMDLIDKVGEIKLTKKGFLPTNVVSDIYHQGFMKDEYVEKGIVKLYKEADSMSVTYTRILIEISGLAKKVNGKLSLTKKGEKTINNNSSLFETILETITLKLNWAYFDGYGENQIGQLGFGFSLILLSKYGQEKRLDSFYAVKYYNAYPSLFDSIEPQHSTRCYSFRTFRHFLNYLGLIKIEEEKVGFNSIKYITKTGLFEKLIKVEPHRTRQ